ncbi:MAG: UbiH/UbiF/VisC/COQ6 family ubiquinone biosynthesis hydroxylase [Alphaproteobacteria bacterium]|nr:UbiH/UbiF/VisC/COQ6 family ubiquinone biosynthesis hydroxylase [Alphaproteobacteria bacterium]MBT5390570.1 UbiH/UbiF/VisC/COQ6 family ubiquinone biosynthesis hydroxylase [Alphaproteobacteria bacterium]MBT5540929.1 UbiH/UbiF/VisC/COQ6 family ubiquinone biosynthesis hydroxylase [Alphaproteobacteria bacterium]MBT5654341.1 UbiH/UbiF/VisC/COQ6 family ubiquinone biosynthesis hydroxylase [Alphaproteobacteria bacterium]
MTNTTKTHDVLIIGSGPTGGTLACALAQEGLSVCLVDHIAPETFLKASSDGRVYALSHGSYNLLKSLNIWNSISEKATPITDIKVCEGTSGPTLHYDHQLVHKPLGYMVEAPLLRKAIVEAINSQQAIQFRAPDQILSLEKSSTGVIATLKSGHTIRTSLVIAADGRNSKIREKAGIEFTEIPYNQHALVCVVHHEHPHNGLAYEKFYGTGPFAALPMNDVENSKSKFSHRSSIVWSDQPETIKALMNLDENTLSTLLKERMGSYYGNAQLSGKRWSYPLIMGMTKSSIAQRLVLLGDAAHAMHPVAGQGLNLGLRDVAALAETLLDAHKLGTDLGSSLLLEKYEQWRKVDVHTLTASTDGIVRFFSNDSKLLKALGSFGFGLIDKMPSLKKPLMKHAMGVMGDLPRSLKG